MTIVRWPEMTVVQEIPVGEHPEGVAWLGQSSLLACCVYGSDEVVLIDAATGQLVRRIEVFDEPYGVVSSRDGQRLYVTLEHPGQVIVLDVATGEQLHSWPVGPHLRGLALTGALIGGALMLRRRNRWAVVLTVAEKGGLILFKNG